MLHRISHSFKSSVLVRASRAAINLASSPSYQSLRHLHNSTLSSIRTNSKSSSSSSLFQQILLLVGSASVAQYYFTAASSSTAIAQPESTSSSSSPSSPSSSPPLASISADDDKECRACRPGEKNMNARRPVASDAAAAAASSSSPCPPCPDCPPCYAYSHSACPLNRAEVGRAGWGYLHTLAAYYPEKPTERQQKEMKDFIYLYLKLYPCGYCADRSLEQLVRVPIDEYLTSQQAFALWMCMLHNEVNERLNKPIFDCKFTQQRWREGPPNGECD